VFRARYSVVSPRDIHRAMKALQRLDRRQIEAVATRQEIDLRSGATLTRLQSMGFQRHFNQLKGVISYGSCQFPTLGFVVEQYLRVVRFIPHDFWTLKLVLGEADISVAFTWDRVRLFDRHACAVLFARAVASAMTHIDEVRSSPTSKWKPLPLR